jgi:hypothetical protein
MAPVQHGKMRTTPIPILTQLPRGFAIVRCRLCGELAFSDEICLSKHEAKSCPAGAESDAH